MIEKVKEVVQKLRDEARENYGPCTQFDSAYARVLEALDQMEKLPQTKAEVFREDDGLLRIREQDGFASITMIGAEAAFKEVEVGDDPIDVKLYIERID